jgi:hypothetical protein
MQNAKLFGLCFIFTIFGYQLANIPPIHDHFHPDEAKVAITEPVNCPTQVEKTPIEAPKCEPIVRIVNSCKRKSHKPHGDFNIVDSTDSIQPEKQNITQIDQPKEEMNNIVFLKADYGYDNAIGFAQVGNVGYAFPNKGVSVGVEYGRRIFDNYWINGEVNVRGDLSVGIGRSFK